MRFGRDLVLEWVSPRAAVLLILFIPFSSCFSHRLLLLSFCLEVLVVTPHIFDLPIHRVEPTVVEFTPG
jgi:hypothetical protein